MGIKGLETFMHRDCMRGVTTTDIRDLVSRGTNNVIVVDGNHFYERYLYDRIDWLYGGIQEFVEDIRKFVKAFEEIGARLVFFFFFGCVREESMRKVYIENRNKNNEFCKNVLQALSKGYRPRDREFGDRPLDVKCLAVYILRKVMKCEVHCGNSEKDAVVYAASNNCLAILSQNSYYIFHEGVPAYLSFASLNLTMMTTVQYNIHAFCAHLQLERKFFPLLAAIIGDNNTSKNAEHPHEVARQKIRRIIIQKLNGRRTSYMLMVSRYIRDNFAENDLVNVPKFLTEQFGEYGEKLISSYDTFKERFSHVMSESSVASNAWESILELSDKLYTSGRLCEEIRDVLNNNFFEHHTILEDFVELPGSGLVYRSLREQMYGILLHEKPKVTNHDVKEWCLEEDGWPLTPIIVSPTPAHENLHPGLLTLWNKDDVADSIQKRRWQLFAHAISPSHDLDCSSLQNLPQNLVIPVSVLFYLLHEVPKKLLLEKLLDPWEVEVFIAVTLMIPTKNVQYFSEMQISHNATNIRAVRLSAFFICGCHTMHLLAQACGLGIEDSSPIFRYFDGKLFHSLYEKLKSSDGTEFLESEIKNETFQKIKKILCK